MFAIIKTGGKQYRVAPGDTIFVEKLLGSAGDTVTLSEVLMVNHDNKIDLGVPFVSGAVVQATIREQARGDKIIVFKKKRRQGYRRKKGHRQDITVLKIGEINMNGATSIQNDLASNLSVKTHTPEVQIHTDLATADSDFRSSVQDKVVPKVKARKPMASTSDEAAPVVKKPRVKAPKEPKD